MNKPSRSRKFSAKQSARLGAYLAAGLGASTAATPTTEAALVVIDVGPSGFNIGNVNGGVTPGTVHDISNFPFAGAGGLRIANDLITYDVAGLYGMGGLEFAFNGVPTSPRNFALNTSIDANAFFTGTWYQSYFKVGGSESPDFGPGSYMGFKTASGNYGWLAVTWYSKSSQFEILSGAYEDQVGVAILAGATAPIPEPGTWVALAVFAGGAAGASAAMRRKKARLERVIVGSDSAQLAPKATKSAVSLSRRSLSLGP